MVLFYHRPQYHIYQRGFAVVKAWRLKNTEKAGFRVPKDKIILVAAIAIAVIIITIIFAVFLVPSPESKGTASLPVNSNFTRPENGVSPAQVQNIPKTVFPTGTPKDGKTPVIQTTVAVPVDFILQSGVPVSCGLTCRQLDATLTNSGYMTAQNVCIAVSMHNSRNEIISLNGESILSRCVGNIAAGQTITESLSVNADCGAFATKCIGETLTLQTVVSSDETTVRFPDQLISV